MLIASTPIIVLSVALPCVVLVLVLWATPQSGAQADCDKKVIKTIRKMWGDDPPSDILTRLAGRITYVYTLGSAKPDVYECQQTIFDKPQSERANARDHLVAKDHKNNKNTNLVVVENDGVVLNLGILHNALVLDFWYVVSLEDDVLAYYQCIHDCDYLYPGCSYTPYVGIAVHNQDPTDPKIQKAITTATEKLKPLGIPLHPKIKTNCDTYV